MTPWIRSSPGVTVGGAQRGEGPLVMGLGNVLLGDDGFGPAVCDELCSWQSESHRGHLPAETRIMDGGTLGTALMPWLVEASAIVIVDAVDLPGTPGSLLVWRPPSLADSQADGGSGLADLLAVAIFHGMPSERVSLVGVIPAAIGPRAGLSTAVRAAVPQAASMAAQEIWKLTGGIG